MGNSVAFWLGLALSVVAGLGVLRRFVIRPATRWIAALVKLAGQVNAASNIALELAGLAGAITNFVVAYNRRLEAMDRQGVERDQRLDTVAELLTDALAAINRLEKGRR